MDSNFEHLILIVFYITVLGIGLLIMNGLRLTNGWYARLQEKMTERRSRTVVVVAFSFFVVVGIVASLFMYDRFLHHIFDLGNMNQAMWNTLHGEPLRMTTFFPFENRMFMHVEPIFFFLAPLYALWQNPQMMLILQVLLIGSGVFPLYFLAKKIIGNNSIATCLALIYLVHPVTIRIVIETFRPLSIALPLILFAFAFFAYGRYRWSFFFFLMCLFSREDIAFLALFSGLFIAFVTKKKIFGTLLAVLALTWIIIIYALIYPTHIGDYLVQYQLYSQFGDSPMDIFKYLLSHPGELLQKIFSVELLSYAMFMLIPFLFTPLFYARILPVAIFSFSVMFFNYDSSALLGGRTHYNAPIIAVTLIAAVYGIQRLQKRIQQKNLTIMSIGMFVVTLCFGVYGASYVTNMLAGQYAPNALTGPQRKAAKEAIRLIPGDVSVVASNDIGAHLSGRKNIYLVPTPRRFDADYIIVRPSPVNPCPDEAPIVEGEIRILICEGTQQQYGRYLVEIDRNSDYERIFDKEGIRVYHKIMTTKL